MKEPSKLILTIALALIFGATAHAQSPDKVLKQAVKALTNGKGEKALREVKSWQSKGRITDPTDGTSGGFQAAAVAPNLYTWLYDLHGKETGAGHNGKSGWVRDTRDGLRTLTGNASRDFQAEASYRNSRWLDYKKEKAKLTVAGQSTINGKPANTLLLTTQKNVRVKLHFDAVTGLPVREEWPEGDETRTLDFADYRPVGNLLEPFALTLTKGAQRLEIKLEQIVHNPTLDRAMFQFPNLSKEPLPDIAQLLKDVGKNEDAIDQLLEKYTYTENVTKREFDNQGQLRDKEAETFELTFYKGNRIRRLIAKNNQPLNAKEEEDEQKRVEKRVRDIEKKEAEKERKAQKERDVSQSAVGTPAPEGERPTISDVLRASRLINPRREQFRGRDVIVFDFEPLPGYKPQKDYEKIFGKMAGALWVDPVDKQVTRVDAKLVEAYKIGGGLVASLKEGASFVLEQERINNEIWLPTRAEINLGVKVFMVKGFNVNQTITYGNYKRFNVDAEKEKLKDPISNDKPSKP